MNFCSTSIDSLQLPSHYFIYNYKAIKTFFHFIFILFIFKFDKIIPIETVTSILNTNKHLHFSSYKFIHSNAFILLKKKLLEHIYLLFSLIFIQILIFLFILFDESLLRKIISFVLSRFEMHNKICTCFITFKVSWVRNIIGQIQHSTYKITFQMNGRR